MTSQQPDAQAAAVGVAIVLAYQQQTQAIRAQIEQYVRSLWASLGLYRESQMRDFVQQILPVLLGAQQHMSALTASYLAEQRYVELGGTSTPIPVSNAKVTGTAVRNGTPMEDVYSRPFHLVWRQLADLPRAPGSIDQAIEAGVGRAVELAHTDVQRAKTQTAFEVGTKDKKVRWMQRVLEGPHSCGLCIVASTQIYHNRPVLLPIHPGCDCSTRYAYGDRYPDQIHDPTLLADVHERIEQRFGASSSAARVIPGAKDARGKLIKYRDVLIQHEHGELGPVLAVKGKPFLGPDDV